VSGERGGLERSSVLSTKRDRCDFGVQVVGGRDGLRDLFRPKTLVIVANECEVMMGQDLCLSK